VPRGTATQPFTIRFPPPLPAERHRDSWHAAVGGRQVRLSNLEKVFWPREGYTKGDLLAYYFNAGPAMLPYLAGRPLTLKRMPDGIRSRPFYQKDAPDFTPDWITRCAIESEEGKVDEMLVVEALADLLFVVNLGCIDLHPLHSRCETYDRPDYLVVDLDPMAPAGFDDALAVARHVGVLLDGLGLTGYAKTSGATGVQIYVPVAAGHTYAQTRAVAERMGEMIGEADPGRVTMDWAVERRSGKVFVDHKMNRRGASLAGVWSVRPEPGATVSTPLSWDEVRAGAVRPDRFTMATVLGRLEEAGDLFEGVLTQGQDLDPVLERLAIPRSLSDDSGGRMRRRLPAREAPRRRT
jgi:bifunctional non-homologous end joining protein LigD